MLRRRLPEALSFNEAAAITLRKHLYHCSDVTL